MALENMTSQFQPQTTAPSNALANNEGLENVTNQGSLLHHRMDRQVKLVKV